jgi:hypothetical protein
MEHPVREQRVALEALGEREPAWLQVIDPHLLHLRETETAADELPAVVGGLQRAHLLSYDRVSTTWLGWRDDGQRGAVRCLRPRWRRDAVIHRRIEQGVRLAANIRGLAPMAFRPHDGWPHVAYRIPGLPIAELLPCEDPPDPLGLGRWLGTALETLVGMHRRGLSLGAQGTGQIILAPHRAFLLWLDPIGAPCPTPRDDLIQLATGLLALDPEGLHPTTQLLQPWSLSPPASAEEASALLRRALADHLVAARHRLVLRSRSADRGERVARLVRAARHLQDLCPPPAGRCCLRAGHDRVLYLVESDGRSVRGGAAAGVPPFGLMPLFTPGKGLDAAATRTLLRAWSQRAQGDVELRLSAQQRWEGSDRVGAALTRWLSAASRLRRAQLLLAYALRS